MNQQQFLLVSGAVRENLRTNAWTYELGVLKTHTWDALGRLTNQWRMGRGNATFKFDSVGNLTNVVYPGSTPAVSFAFDALDRATNMIDGVGTTRWTYHPNGMPVSEDGPWNTDTVVYAYTNGLRSGLWMDLPNASPWYQSYTHDEAGRLTSIASPAGMFNYGYAASGCSCTAASRVQQLIYPNGMVMTNQFDTSGRLLGTYLRDSLGQPLNQHVYQFTGDQITRQTYFDSGYVDYSYVSNQLSGATGYNPAGASRPQEHFRYGYDAAGNLLARTNNDGRVLWSFSNKNQPDSATRNTTFTIAARANSSQNVNTILTTATVNSQSVTPNTDGSFAKSGITLADGNNTFTASATDAMGRSASATNTVYLPLNVSYTYGSDGNMTSDGRMAYTWDDEGQLLSLVQTGAWKTEFVYDGLKRLRIRKEYASVSGAWLATNEVRYVYDGNLPTQERHFDPRLTMSFPHTVLSYTRGRDLSGSLDGAGGVGGLLARTEHKQLATSHSYYHSDHLDNVTALVDTRQQVVGRYRYDPYGNILGIEGEAAEANGMRYSSKEWHRNSGLYSYGRRFYSPNMQRWVNKDPASFVDGPNVFGFVYGNVTRRIDPFGLIATDSQTIRLGSNRPFISDHRNPYGASWASAYYTNGPTAFYKDNRCQIKHNLIWAERLYLPDAGIGRDPQGKPLHVFTQSYANSVEQHERLHIHIRRYYLKPLWDAKAARYDRTVGFGLTYNECFNNLFSQLSGFFQTYNQLFIKRSRLASEATQRLDDWDNWAETQPSREIKGVEEYLRIVNFQTGLPQMTLSGLKLESTADSQNLYFIE